MTQNPFAQAIWAVAGGAGPPGFAETGQGDLTSAFPVSDLAVGAIAAAGAAVAELIATATGHRPSVTVDRRLASLWFSTSIRPIGWTLPPSWDSVAGDYRTADGWIRLHTNAPHHRRAALAALGIDGERDEVAAAVATWTADALEQAVVDAGGCAATMRSVADWAEHPQGRSVAAEPLLHRTTAPGALPFGPVDPARPLAGLRVLDLTRVLAGPAATRFLAAFGANVLRIDPPFWVEDALEPEMTLGKTCAGLDLRDPVARDRLRDLLASADILVHGYRSDALDGIGLGPAERAQIRPGLIDVSLDAYGWTGPWARRRGFDSLVQMSSGIAHAGMAHAGMGHPGADKPTPLPVQALDHATGYILATAAIRGLTERLRTGHSTLARASLARTATLLTSHKAGPAQSKLGAPTDMDYSPTPEPTAWGDAYRLRPALHITDATMSWSHRAAPLRSSPPHWP